MGTKSKITLQEFAGFLLNVAYADNLEHGIEWRLAVLHPRTDWDAVGFAERKAVKLMSNSMIAILILLVGNVSQKMANLTELLKLKKRRQAFEKFNVMGK